MKLPKLSPPEIELAMKCAARCDARMAPEDWLRTYRYELDWSDDIIMARYDNGSGDHVVAFFGPGGRAVIKGFDHESEVSPHARDEFELWPGIYDGLPADLLLLLQDPAVEHEDVTFCCWSLGGKTWKTGSAVIPDHIDDGSAWLLDMVQMKSEEFIDWARSCYETDFDRVGEDGVRAAFQ